MPAQQNSISESALGPRFPAAHRVLLDAIQQRVFPGATYGVFLRGEMLTIEAAGHFTYDSIAPPVRPDTVFDLASLSKVVGTTAMAMLLWERGQLELDKPVGEHLPAFVQQESPSSLKRMITPRMLLAHSSGLPAYSHLYKHCQTMQALLDACLHMPLEAAPESQAVYSDIGFIILGHLLETLTGERLDSYCRREIFAPIGMESTVYCPPQPWKASIPPTGIDDCLRHRVLQGEVHDDNCWVLGGVSGHAGLFSNGPDLLRFAGSILRGGMPVLHPETISKFTARQSRPVNSTRALGWDTPSAPSSSGEFFSTHSAGHLGYTGTSLWIDFEKELAVVLLTNRTFPGGGPEGISEKIRQVRPRFHDTMMRELGMNRLPG